MDRRDFLKTTAGAVVAGAAAPVVEAQSKPTATQGDSDVEKRIRSAVIARLGNQVDAKLLDSINHRVIKGVGLK